MPAAVLDPGSSQQQQPTSRKAASHQPFRLQVQDVTPVSISLLWSLRPPPISAIHASSSSSCSNTATRTASGSTTALRQRLSKVVRATTSRTAAEADDWPSDGDGATAVEDDDEEEEDTPAHIVSPTTPTAPGGYDSEGDATAAAAVGTAAAAGAGAGQEMHRPHAVASSSARMARILESGVCVTVNSVPWAHVVMGDRGSDEAIIVVYGLLPGREYSVELSIGGRQTDKPVVALAQETDREASVAPSPEDSPSVAEAVPQLAPSAAPTSTAPLALGASTSVVADVASHVSEAALAAEVEASHALRTSLTSELRKSRKDAQRAEGALRAEIEIIKRGLDRMTGTDHRSKQKTLALQESIRQATLHARELDEETKLVEAQLPDWQRREDTQTQELEGVRFDVERKAALAEAEIGKDLQALESREKELAEASRALEQKSAERDRLQKERMAQLEGELTKLHTEIDRTLHAPPPGFGGYAGAGGYGGSPHRIQATAASFVPTQALPRSGGRGGSAAALGRGAGPSVRGGSLSRSGSGFSTFHPQRRPAARVASGSPHQASTDAFAAYGTASPIAGASPVLTHEGFTPSFTTGGTSALNALGPEFIPASASANPSPVITKARAQAPNVSAASPSTSTTAAAVAGVQRNSPLLASGSEYSPTTTARFALPAAALRAHANASNMPHFSPAAAQAASPPAALGTTSGTTSPAQHLSPAVKNAMLNGGTGVGGGGAFDVGSRRGSFAAAAAFEGFSTAPTSRAVWAATPSGPSASSAGASGSATSSPWSNTISLPPSSGAGADIWSSPTSSNINANASLSSGGVANALRNRTSIPHVNVSARHGQARAHDLSPPPGSIGDALVASAPTSPTSAAPIGTPLSTGTGTGAGVGSSPRSRTGGSAPMPGSAGAGGVGGGGNQPLSFASVAVAGASKEGNAPRREASA